MDLTDEQRALIIENPSPAMITVGSDGRPKAVRVSVGFVDGRLLSSSTAERVRTKRLRGDPRCTLYVSGGPYQFVALETTVVVLDGDEVVPLTESLMRLLQKRPTGPIGWFGADLEPAAFRATLVEEGRVLYEFSVTKAYGMG